MPKTIVRCLSILVCLGVLLAVVPGLNSAVRSTPKANGISLIARQPLFLFSSLFPAIPMPSANGQVKSKSSSSASRMTAKPTGDTPAIRPSEGD